jgi:Tfp pilus assembly protein PilN
MNAVNLIPGDRRKRSVSVSVSPLTLGVIGGLVVVLVAAVLYVFAVNDVRARKSELASVTANAASWQAAASSYASYVTAAQQQKQQLADIQQLVTGRFPWSVLLSQIGGVMPDDAALSSLQATSPSAAAGASAAAGPTSSSTETSQPIQITGCAASQSAVAATMIALGRVQGVSSVALSSTTGSATSSTSASARSGSSSNGCPFPVSFSLSLLLASPSTTGTASGTASGATAPTSTATTPAATAAASTATTPSTASAQ